MISDSTEKLVWVGLLAHALWVNLILPQPNPLRQINHRNSLDSATLLNGEVVKGKLHAGADGRWDFIDPSEAHRVPIASIRRIALTGTGEQTPAPKFRFELWSGDLLVGDLQKVDPEQVLARLSSERTIAIPLAAIAVLKHNPSSVRILDDRFVNAPRSVRKHQGQIIPHPDEPTRKALALSEPGDFVHYRFEGGFLSGELALLFWDQAASDSAATWEMEFGFRSASGVKRLQLQATSDFHGLLAPDGPALAVEPLARSRGWHRAQVRFGPKELIVLIDKAVLTSDLSRRVQLGTLDSLRVRLIEAPAQTPALLVASIVADKRLGEFTNWQPSDSQDDLRLLNGDQLFGTILAGGDQWLRINTVAGTTQVDWAEIQMIKFAARPSGSSPIDGQWVRWNQKTPARSTFSGVLRAVNDRELTILHPYIGSVELPRGSGSELEFQASGRRLVLSAGYYHVGDSVDPQFARAAPQGTALSWRFELERPPRQGVLELVVEELESMTDGARFFDELQDGQLRTYLDLNGSRLTPRGLNENMPANSGGPITLRIPIRPGWLRGGSNLLRLSQTPLSGSNSYDDFGILQISLLFEEEP